MLPETEEARLLFGDINASLVGFGRMPGNFLRTGLVWFILLMGLWDAEIHAANRPKNQGAWKAYRQAMKKAGEGRHDAAGEALKRIIERYPSFFPAYLKLEEMYRYGKTPEKTLKYFRRLAEKRGENPFLLHARGRVYLQQKKYGEAYRLFALAIRMDSEYSAVYPDFIRANRTLEEAEATLLQLLERKPTTAAVHLGLAQIYGMQLRYREEIRAAARALSIDPNLPGGRLLLAEAHYWEGDYEVALKVASAGLEAARTLRDVETQIKFLNLTALIENKRGNYERALSLLSLALQMSEMYGAKGQQIQVLNYLARLNWYRSEYRTALDAALRAASVAEEIEDSTSWAINRKYAGIFYAELGDYTRALECFEKAKAYYQRTQNMGMEAICRGNIASVLVLLGELDRAVILYRGAVKALEKLGAGWNKARANYLGCTGDIFERQGEHEKALTMYGGALSILQKMKTEGHQVRTYLIKMGRVYRKQGKFRQAIRYFDRARQTQTRIFKRLTEMDYSLQMGRLDLAMGRPAQAYRQFLRASELAQMTQNVEVLWQAEAGQAAALRKMGDLHRAYRLYQQAAETVERLRGRITDDGKTRFMENKVQIYAGIIGLLAELHEKYPEDGYDELAFYYAERARARSFLEMIGRGRLFLRLGEIPEDFRQKYVSTLDALRRKHTHLSQELAKENGRHSVEKILRLQEEIERLERQKVILQRQLRDMFPRYYDLTHPEIFRVSDVQQKILGTRQILVEFFVGEKQTYVWTITRNRLRFDRVPFGQQRLADLLDGISPLFRMKKDVRDVRLDYRWANIRPEKLHRLYRILFQRVAETLIEPGAEIIIVPDGLLYYFPFEILVTRYSSNSLRYLVESHPISYSISASLLNPALQRHNGSSRGILAIGNPDLGGLEGRSVSLFKPDVRRRLEPLPFAKLEAETVARRFSRRMVLAGREATEKRFKGTAGSFQIIHLAAHNIADDRQPMYSRMLLAHSSGEEDDGLLQTYEIYNLRLQADLVVLSGCDTGLGRLSQGEGLIGMTRAFFYAGTPSLVASLWPVNDRSTARLMDEFYQNLERGVSRAKALQLAKISLIRSAGWEKDPFYWGAFVLMGDWRPVEIR